MSSTPFKFKGPLILIIPLVIILLSLARFPSQSGAAPALPPPRNTNTPPPSATSPPSVAKPDRSPGGGYITLHITAAPAGLWTVVQWQDSAGNWHDVEGWRGTASNGSVEWWVAPKDLGTGPFRWAVYQKWSGKLLGSSSPFNLPDAPGESAQVEVLLENED